MAAKTSSVSYQHNLSEEILERALTTGEVALGFEAHIGHLLRQVPVEYVVMAVEETAQVSSEIWSNVARLATSLSPNRKELWI